MFSSFWGWVRANQPVSTTGAISHTYYWLTSLMSGDIVYRNPNFKTPETSDPSLRKGVAIYCVHGTGDQPGAFVRIIERLIKKGLPDHISSIHSVGFEHRYQGKGIKFFAKELIEKIKTNGHEHVILIGHSRGGLVISQAAEFLAEESGIHVHSLFPICAPYKGSAWAMKPLTLVSTSVAQMEPEAAILHKLNEAISNSTKEYNFIGVDNDGLVTTDSSYVDNYVKKNPGASKIFDRHGHLSVMSSWRLVDHIYQGILAVGRRLFPDMAKEKNVREEATQGELFPDDEFYKIEPNS
ncbi:alpha/beta hydrolase [Legionella hackeliae]|uniref:Putative lipase n=1 Tax=Legionella hackeliae TaxID=449 RepID=A0A0A8USF3_LEGHA|nr:alpha/beta hydrolase [Legionella hackeliae]KTD10194.1 putative lipase [Legionella hackeliae]CEK09689.1 putative lipase [Legionella hackeliae]STX49599.1 putative lipase [Legionella hackeliae]